MPSPITHTRHKRPCKRASSCSEVGHRPQLSSQSVVTLLPTLLTALLTGACRSFLGRLPCETLALEEELSELETL